MEKETEWYNLKLHLHTSELDKVRGKLVIISTIGHNPLFMPLEMNWENEFKEESLKPWEHIREAINQVSTTALDAKEVVKELNKLASAVRCDFAKLEEKPLRKRYDVIPKGFYKKKRY